MRAIWAVPIIASILIIGTIVVLPALAAQGTIVSINIAPADVIVEEVIETGGGLVQGELLPNVSLNDAIGESQLGT